MIVIDASVVAPALADDGDDGDRARTRLRGERLLAPELLDLEVVSALRRAASTGDLDGRRAARPRRLHGARHRSRRASRARRASLGAPGERDAVRRRIRRPCRGTRGGVGDGRRSTRSSVGTTVQYRVARVSLILVLARRERSGELAVNTALRGVRAHLRCGRSSLRGRTTSMAVDASRIRDVPLCAPRPSPRPRT